MNKLLYKNPVRLHNSESDELMFRKMDRNQVQVLSSLQMIQ